MIRAEVNQEILPRPARLDKKWLDRLLRLCCRYLRLRQNYAVSIAFIAGRTMRRLNRAYRGKDRLTDILSFEGSGSNWGELLLAWPYVRQQAKKKQKILREELALLLIHGILHLRGYDHETKADAAKMLPLQQKILKDFLRGGN